jgi:hypothetical protein
VCKKHSIPSSIKIKPKVAPKNAGHMITPKITAGKGPVFTVLNENKP